MMADVAGGREKSTFSAELPAPPGHRAANQHPCPCRWLVHDIPVAGAATHTRQHPSSPALTFNHSIAFLTIEGIATMSSSALGKRKADGDESQDGPFKRQNVV